jgi:hypothetical protein
LRAGSRDAAFALPAGSRAAAFALRADAPVVAGAGAARLAACARAPGLALAPGFAAGFGLAAPLAPPFREEVLREGFRGAAGDFRVGAMVPRSKQAAPRPVKQPAYRPCGVSCVTDGC